MACIARAHSFTAPAVGALAFQRAGWPGCALRVSCSLQFTLHPVDLLSTPTSVSAQSADVTHHNRCGIFAECLSTKMPVEWNKQPAAVSGHLYLIISFI